MTVRISMLIPTPASVGPTGQTGMYTYHSPDLTYFDVHHCREAFYKWRIVPRALIDTNVRDLSSE